MCFAGLFAAPRVLWMGVAGCRNGELSLSMEPSAAGCSERLGGTGRDGGLRQAGGAGAGLGGMGRAGEGHGQGWGMLLQHRGHRGLGTDVRST